MTFNQQNKRHEQIGQADQHVELDNESGDALVIVDATVVEQVENEVMRLRTECPARRIVVLTASPTWQRARAAFAAGAMDYLPNTLDKKELRRIFDRLCRQPLPPWPAAIEADC